MPLAGYVALLATGTGEGAPQETLYFTVMGGACALASARGFVGRDRAVWRLMAAAMLLWLAGDVWWELLDPPGISPADGLYVAFYALAIPGLVLLLRRRASGTLATLWADGWVASLAVASVAAYFFVEPALAGSRGGSLVELLVNLAYPIGDTLLLALVVGAIVATRGRMQRSWGALCAALVVMAVSDGIYFNLSWSGTYADGSLLESGWAVAALCLAWSAWLTYAEPSLRRVATDRAPIVWPVLWGGGSLALVAVLGVAEDSHPISTGLAVAGVLSVFGRLMLTDAQNRRLARAASAQALTDPVTGLGNHRALTGDLREALATTPPERRVLLAIYDLNGFKDYNDRFGHRRATPCWSGSAAGCATSSRRSAARTGWAVTSSACSRSSRRAWGRSCCSPGSTTRSPSRATGSRSARPPATCWPSRGPRRRRRRCAPRTSACMRPSAARAPRRCSRRPTCSPRSPASVARRSTTTGSPGSPSAPPGSWGWTTRASPRSATPRACTTSASSRSPTRSSRSPARWTTQSSSSSARTRSPVSASQPRRRCCCRSRGSYARATSAGTGAGYPDGLAGEDIPLGARVVFACDAFEAMTAERAWRPAMGEADALAELIRNAGTQFGPAVVRAFAAALAREDGASALAA